MKKTKVLVNCKFLVSSVSFETDIVVDGANLDVDAFCYLGDILSSTEVGVTKPFKPDVQWHVGISKTSSNTHFKIYTSC